MNYKLMKLGAVSDITKLAGFEFTKYIKYNEEGEIIALRALNLRKGELDLTDIKRIDRAVSDSLIRSKLYLNDILLTYTGNGYGDCAIITENDKYHLAPNICKITPNTKMVDPYFLYSYIRSNLFYQTMSSNMTGSSQPTIPMKTLRVLEVPIPAMDVQRKIGSIIKSIDEKIRNNSHINRNLYEQAITIFEQVYQTYQTAKIGDTDVFVTDYVANGSFKSLKENVTILEDKDYAYFIRNVDLKAKSFPRFVDQHSYEFLSKSKLEGGEVIISNVGDVGSVFLCPKLDGPMTLGNNMIMLKSEKHNNYLYLYFMSYNGQGMIDGITGGSAQPKFNKTDFKSLEINYPSDKEVEDFNSKVSPLLNLIGCVDMENQRLQALRDTLLPKLMSGELDVSELDI